MSVERSEFGSRNSSIRPTKRRTGIESEVGILYRQLIHRLIAGSGSYVFLLHLV